MVFGSTIRKPGARPNLGATAASSDAACADTATRMGAEPCRRRHSVVVLDRDARRGLDPQSQAADQRLGSHTAGGGEDASERLARDAHMPGGLGLLQADEVGKTQRLQPVQRKHESAKLLGSHANRPEFCGFGRRTHIAPLVWSRHSLLEFMSLCS